MPCFKVLVQTSFATKYPLTPVALSVLETLLKDLAQKDFLTYQHSIAVAEHMRNLAIAQGQSEESANEAEIFGAIHDICKTTVDAAIFRRLQAGEQLEAQERQALQHQPEQIFELISKDILPQAVQEGVPHIECRFDGKGQPNIEGESIHLFARMLKICDYYDMLMRQRTGRNPLSEEQALMVLEKNQGVLFDPILVTIFSQMLQQNH